MSRYLYLSDARNVKCSLCYRLSRDIFNQTVCILNHLAEEKGVHWSRRWAVLSLAVHTKAAHSQQQRGQARMWPPSSFRWPDIAQQPWPPGANTIHNMYTHWTEEQGGGWQGLWVSAACQCVIVLRLINNRQPHLLFLGFLVLPVEFHFVHQMRGILGTILKRLRVPLNHSSLYKK